MLWQGCSGSRAHLTEDRAPVSPCTLFISAVEVSRNFLCRQPLADHGNVTSFRIKCSSWQALLLLSKVSFCLCIKPFTPKIFSLWDSYSPSQLQQHQGKSVLLCFRCITQLCCWNTFLQKSSSSLFDQYFTFEKSLNAYLPNRPWRFQKQSLHTQ